MAVASVEETWQGRSGSDEGVNAKESTRTFIVQTNNRFDDDTIVLASDLLPSLYSVHPHDPAMTARRREAIPHDDSRVVWDVTIEYSSESVSAEQQENEAQPIPTSRPVRIRWSSTQYAKAIDKDINGHALVNSAHDYFDPPPEIDSSRWVATVSANVAAVPAYILTYADAINATSFSISGVSVEAKKAKLTQLEISELQVENDTEFYTFTYSLEFRDEGWQLEILDQGFHYLDSSDGDTKKIITVDGERVSSPQLLAGDGELLDSPSAATAVHIVFDVYHERDFSVLPGIS